METTSSMGNSETGAAAADAVNRTVQGAHTMVDRAAEKAGPAAERLHQGIDSAGEALKSGVEDLDEMQERWLEATRDMVRDHPLVAVGIAVAAGMLISRITAR